MPFQIIFPIPPSPAAVLAFSGAHPCLRAEYRSGHFSVELYYDRFPGEPLVLHADNVREGDDLFLNVCDFRIELYHNDKIEDEEWPCGTPLFRNPERQEGDLAFDVTNNFLEPTENDNFSFLGAEGFYPGGGVRVGDCMPYVFGDRFHVLYLKDRHRHHSKWKRGAHQWEHISSRDLLHWDVHPMAVPIDDPEEGSICTGSFLEHNGIHYLFYTVRTVDGSPAPIRRSLSRDGYHFEKDQSFSFTLCDRYTAASARDPKVVRGDDGIFHMFVTTTRIADKKGCLVHLTSHDLDHWTETEFPIYVAPDGNEPECSDYFRFSGKYYLVFSHYGKAEYRYSDHPFNGWQTPSSSVIPCGIVPKAGIWHDRLIFVGFDNGGDGYAGKMIFREMHASPSGELFPEDTLPVPEYRKE